MDAQVSARKGGGNPAACEVKKMSYFYVQACRNGHFQITNKKLQPDAVCETCGLPLMDKCPECGEYIRKWTLYGATPILPGKDDYELADRCDRCGSKFPWSDAKGSDGAQAHQKDKRFSSDLHRAGGEAGNSAASGARPFQKADGFGSGKSFPETEDFGGRKSLREGMRPDSQALLQDMHQANGEAALVRKAYNEAVQREYDSCSYAFFPGCQLGAAEPEIVIKAYDSIRFQHPDTAMFLQCCGFAAGMAGDHEAFQSVLDGIKEKWTALGQPTMIMACPACQRIFQAHLPDIPVVSLYEMLRDMGVSGGCHSEDYIFSQMVADTKAKAGSPGAGKRAAAKSQIAQASDAVADASIEDGEKSPDARAKAGTGSPHAGSDSIAEAVRGLAEDMGAKLHSAEEKTTYPHLVSSINRRDQLKREGKEAVHILELIFGMGASNLHLEHEHTHDHGDEDRCQGHHDHMDAYANESDSVQSDMMEEDARQIERGGTASDPEMADEPVSVLEMADEPAAQAVFASRMQAVSAPLPSPAERWQNRLELKQTLLEFFWNESHE